MDPHGNFSIQVLRSALQNQFGLELPNLRQEGISSQEPTTLEGFICNKQSHWFAIRKINGRYWNLNSTADRPVVISHFNVATELDKLIKDGYSVFCVANEETTTPTKHSKNGDNNNNKQHASQKRKQPQHLPPACTSVQEMERRKDRQPQHVKGNWWKESDLFSGIGAATGTKGSAGGDPWKNVGSGMRLDGTSTAQQQNNTQDWSGLTEEEQLQMAVAMSMETPATTTESKPDTMETVTVPPEPAAGTSGAVRIQFRLPSNPRVVRRFLNTDTVAVVMSFCAETEQGATLDLRYGFPPKDLKPLAHQTIAEAKLAGESIQGRRI